MITGINHINLAVRDIDTSFIFYKDVLGFTPLCKSKGSAYFLTGSPDDPTSFWVSLDLDRHNLRHPSPCNSHIAFSVPESAFNNISTRITASGATIFKENTSPGDSLYFLDPDGHKLEIHAGNWQMRIASKKQNPGNWENVEWFI